MTIISPYSFPGIARKKTLSIDDIINAIYPDDKEVMSKSRKAGIVIKRQIVMYLSRHSAHKTYADIGNHFSTDHATVINACKRVQGYIDIDPEFKANISQMSDRVKVKSLLGV